MPYLSRSRSFLVPLLCCSVANTVWAQSPVDAEVVEVEVVAEAEPAGAPSPEAVRDQERDDVVDVTVVGTPVAQTGGSAHVVKQSQLERFEYDDPNAALMQVPGVTMRHEDGIGLRPNLGIRGVNPDRSKKVTLLEDGVLFGPAPYSAPAAYYFPLITRMTGIRVIKGPAAVAYGPQTIGGTVDFVSRAVPAAPSGALDLALGEFGYKKAHGFFGTSSDQSGFLLEGVRLHNTGFKVLPDGADTGSTRNEWVVKGFHLLDPRANRSHELTAKLSYSDEVSNETYLGLTDVDLRRAPDRRYPASALDQMRNHRTSLVLSHHTEALGSAWQLTSTAYRHDYERSWRKLNRFGAASIAEVLHDPETPANAELYAVLTGQADSVSEGQTLFIGPNLRRFVSQGVQSKLQLRGATGALKHRAEAGVRLHNDSIYRHHSESGYSMLAGELVPNEAASFVSAANRGSTTALALHAMNAMTWRRLTVTPGLRAELIRSNVVDLTNRSESKRDLAALMPGLGVYVAVIDEIGLLAGVYRGFSPPPPGSKDVDPEASLNYEAGLRGRLGELRLEVIGFYNDYSNLTNLCTFSGGCIDDSLNEQADAGRARIYGLESYLTHELSWRGVKLPLTVAYTRTHGEFGSSFRSADPIYGEVEVGDEIPYLPRHQLGATLGVEWSHAGASLAMNYVSAMREEAGPAGGGDALLTEEQLTVDVGSKIMPISYLTFYGNVRNLLDARSIVARRPFGARPNAPRWVQIGARVSY